MKKITNLKTTKSYKQKKDKLSALKAKKKFHLKNTDWTQIADVNIANINQVKEWRQKLRDVKITENDIASEKALEDILAEMPEIQIEKFSSSTGESDNLDLLNTIKDKIDTLYKEINYLRSDISKNKSNIKTSEEQLAKLFTNFSELHENVNDIRNEVNNITDEMNPSNENILLDEQQARKFAQEIFIKYKNEKLTDNGILEYNMMRTLLEEAIDKRMSDDSNTPLLEEYLKCNPECSIGNIIENCKSFFKRINLLYADLAKEQQKIYNMSSHELNEWFKNNGYRYRCFNTD